MAAQTRPGAHRPPATVDFRLLGDLDVRIGGVRWKAPSRKPRRLLAALLLEPRRQVPRERLLRAVWDGEPPRSAAGAIQVYASQLRRVLPGCALVHAGEGYLLDIEPRTVDLHRFRHLVADAHALPTRARAARLREALGLFRGEPLADIGSDSLRRENEPVIVEERLSALEHLADLELALGQGDRLVPELLRLTRAHPLRERLWEQLIRCQTAAGHRAAATASYEQARRLLHEELGVSPGPGLRACLRALRDGDAVPVTAAVRATAARTSEIRGPGGSARAAHPAVAPAMSVREGGGTAPVAGGTAVPAGPEPLVPASSGGPYDGAATAGPGWYDGIAPTGPGSCEGAASAGAAEGSERPADHTAPTGPAMPMGTAVPTSPAMSTGPAVPTGPAGPNMLPRDLADFTGRTAELARAHALAHTPGPRAAILAVTGMAGVGKTALATRIAHEVSPTHPDGQLFLDLHGHDPSPGSPGPLPAHEALDLLLRMLGEPGGDPVTSTEGTAGAGGEARLALLAARWRAALARRRVVVVLDDAVDAAHLRPLLPGDSASLVIVTSRRPLAEVDGAQPLPLGPLTASEAHALLADIVGTGRAARTGPAPANLAEVAAHCGNLPLALRLAGVRLRQRPAWSARALVRGLRGEGALDELRLGSRSVGQSFDTSYHRLPEPERRLFRALGRLSGPDADAAVAGTLTGLPPHQTRAALEGLLDHGLLEQCAGDRFRLHPLLRWYALRAARREEAEHGSASATVWHGLRERAAPAVQHEGPERAAAVVGAEHGAAVVGVEHGAVRDAPERPAVSAAPERPAGPVSPEHSAVPVAPDGSAVPAVRPPGRPLSPDRPLRPLREPRPAVHW
ncbi:BTAD domain-containing putative transcriptional regulator [Streptomyces sp. NPDC057638]|uniref:AfsR/SARP family transcriptional regulator n=1 Tax=Streptomyces sp. NPDC057638 TaxID=3346190 RepID=UPI0036A05413